MSKYSAITVEPAKKSKEASLSIKEGSVHVSGWRVDLHGRPGTHNDYAEEFALAALDYLASKLRGIVKNKALLRAEPDAFVLTPPQLEFEAERMACLTINIAAGKESSCPT